MDGTVRYRSIKFWVFAGADRGGAAVTFSNPCVGNATAIAKDETGLARSTRVRSQTAFADKNAVHIYPIDGGSSRRLAK